MKKNHYEKPRTLRTEVEVENGFLAASVVDKDENNSEVSAGNQEIEGDYDFTDPDQNPWS